MNDHQQSRADALLYEHDDGGYAVASTAEDAAFTRDDPAWHRLGPVIVYGNTTASPIEQPAPLTAQAEQHADWRGDFERQANAAGFDLSREEFGGEYCHPDSADAFRWYYTGRLDEACSGTPSSQPAAAPIEERIRMLETQLSGERRQVEIWKARAKEWCTKFNELEDMMFRIGDRATSANETGAEGAKPIAWFIDWPDEPELGHYFAEEPCDPKYGRSRALGFIESRSPAMVAAAPADERATGLRRIGYATLQHGEPIHVRLNGTMPETFAEGYSGAPVFIPTEEARAAASPAAETVTENLWGIVRRLERGYNAQACANELRALLAVPQPAQADARDEDTYVAKRMAETLATVYATIIGDDPVDADDDLNAIERVVRAAQVLRLEVDLYRAQADAPAEAREPDCWAILTPNGSRLVSPDEAKGRKDAYPLYTAPPTAKVASLTDEQRNVIENAMNCLDAAVTLTQDGYDGEPGPASQWDAHAHQLVRELRALLNGADHA
ncbi:hypothetical protein BW21_4759 [Burkholderia humptydooensis]|uniref:Gp38 n=1 Tax=Burkholderia humptydooensis MSMB43 TaxID=441157 RepID=A0ABN0G0Q0_9BURK|nr:MULTISPECIES: hypothetical protein [Burkholderia]AJY38937.1 hypothetical protein BW21_4759 [Burkholderia sp. 2002721687]ALX46449.1 hypothetical protein AQ610_29310 [Burkholderia humptydooensis]EIP85882.1 gp38 [Burkholderia humptydooensis MSMB43]